LPEFQPGKKLILIDAMSLVFRAFHAPMQMDLRSPSGMPTKAVYIFVRTLRKILKDHRPDLVGVAFDLAAPTFRDKLFERYKANRPEFPEELAVQLPYVRRFCQAMGVKLVEKEGFEADDVMGTLAKRGSDEGLNAFIVSGDQDLYQLVDQHTFVLKPRGGSVDRESFIVPMTPDEIVEEANQARLASHEPELTEDQKQSSKKTEEGKLQEALDNVKLSNVELESVLNVIGVKPSQVVDWLALTGDPSDNIRGSAFSRSGATPRAGGQKAKLHRAERGNRSYPQVRHARQGARKLRAGGKAKLPRRTARFQKRSAAQSRTRHHPARRTPGCRSCRSQDCVARLS